MQGAEHAVDAVPLKVTARRDGGHRPGSQASAAARSHHTPTTHTSLSGEIPPPGHTGTACTRPPPPLTRPHRSPSDLPDSVARAAQRRRSAGDLPRTVAALTAGQSRRTFSCRQPAGRDEWRPGGPSRVQQCRRDDVRSTRDARPGGRPGWRVVRVTSRRPPQGRRRRAPGGPRRSVTSADREAPAPGGFRAGEWRDPWCAPIPLACGGGMFDIVWYRSQGDSSHGDLHSVRQVAISATRHPARRRSTE